LSTLRASSLSPYPGWIRVSCADISSKDLSSPTPGLDGLVILVVPLGLGPGAEVLVCRHLLLNGLLPQRPIRTSARLLLVCRRLVPVPARLSRGSVTACQVRLGFLLPPCYLRSWLALRATRPQCDAVTGRRCLSSCECRATDAVLVLLLSIASKGKRTDLVVAVRGVFGGVLVLSPAFYAEHVHCSFRGAVLVAVIFHSQPGTSA